MKIDSIMNYDLLEVYDLIANYYKSNQYSDNITEKLQNLYVLILKEVNKEEHIEIEKDVDNCYYYKKIKFKDGQEQIINVDIETLFLEHFIKDYLIPMKSDKLPSEIKKAIIQLDKEIDKKRDLKKEIESETFHNVLEYEDSDI